MGGVVLVDLVAGGCVVVVACAVETTAVVVAGFAGRARILLRLIVLSRLSAGRVDGTEVAQEPVESVAQKVRRMGRAAQVGLRCPGFGRGVRGGNIVFDDGRGVDFASRHECAPSSQVAFEATADDGMDHSWEDHGRTLHLP